MLTDEEIAKKIRTQPEMFDHYYKRKEYISARLTELKTLHVAMFLELDEKERLELFGTRQTEEPVEGAFKEERCLKAQLEYMKAGYDTQKLKYDEVMAMLGERNV